MKIKILFIIISVVCSTALFAQLKVLPNGNLGIGTSSPTQKLHVVGNSYFTGNVGIGTNSPAFKLDTRGEIRFGMWEGTWESIRIDWQSENGSAAIFPEQSWYLHLGKPNKGIGNIYVHWLHSYLFSSTSDEKAKENINKLENPIEKIKQISGYTYNYKTNIFSESIPKDELSKLTKIQIGFLAQELATTFPELVVKPDTNNEFYEIHYDGMIPVLLEAIKEQQSQIDSLKQELSYINNTNQTKSGERTDTDNSNNEYNYLESSILLYQNAPNPFSEETVIKCFIPQTIQNAQLCIYNMNGTLMHCIQVNERGESNIVIQGGQLLQGIYTYLIIADGRASETKQMILTK